MEDFATPAPAASSDPGAWPFPRRFVAIFTSPRALFEHLENHPSWFAPLLVSLLLVVIYIVVLWQPVMLPEMLARFEEKGTPDNVVEMMTRTGLIWSTIPAIIAIFVVNFLTALIVQGIGGFVLGGKLSYRQALSIVCHAGLIAVPALIVMMPLAIVAKSAQVSVGPGMLMPAASVEGFGPRFLALVLSSIDVFKLWQVAVTGLGVSVIGHVPRGKATVAMFVAYFIASLLGACVGAALPR